MEQMTPGEWAKEQLKRAPSFAIATAIVAGMLLLSTFIEYSSARGRPPELAAVEADLKPEQEQNLADLDQNIDPADPELNPADPVPEDEVRDVSPIDAPLDDTTLDTDFTEDDKSDVLEASDPVPMEFTKKMAVIGISAGAGGFRGVLGGRSAAGKRRAAHRFGMPKGTDKAILAALRWLKKVQNKETGGWDCAKWGGNRGADKGVSGLALLAFLGFGCTDKQPREFALTVRKAIQFLLNEQRTSGDKKGWFGERMYTQGICTMALAEAYAMTNRRRLKEGAQDGLDYILSLQPSYGGFSYTGPGTDTSVTGFQLQAIKSAYIAKLNVPTKARASAEHFLKICMAKNYSTPYRINATADVQGGGSLSMTAASLTGRLFLGHKRTAPDCVGQAKFLTQNDQHVQLAKAANNLYSTYYLSLSMFNMGGDYWRSWNRAFNAPLRAKQVQAGPLNGSWPTQGFLYGGHGGRIYTTSMACLALEIYFRFLPTYRSIKNF